MVRGARGGRGGFRGRGGGYSGGGGGRPFIPRSGPRPPFDLALCESSFPRVRPLPDDTEFTQALLKRHGELTPTPSEQAAVMNLVTKVDRVVENLSVVPGDFATFQLVTVRHVGAFKQGTMLKGHNVADFVFILKTIPTKEAVERLSIKVSEELRNLLKKDPGINPNVIQVTINKRGFCIGNGVATVRILVGTINQNLRKLKPDVHLPFDILRSHSLAIGHAMWFEENVQHSSIKVLVRLLKDLCIRHSGLSSLKPWLLDTLAHHAVMNNATRQALPINLAFRRALQLLSSGLYLPGSTGITSPLNSRPARGHHRFMLSPEQMDTVTTTAQTLFRVLSRGGFLYVLGLEDFEHGKDISCEITVWDGIVVSPLTAAYEPPEAKMDADNLQNTPMDVSEIEDSNPATSS